jgi:hypothetical protein
MKEEFDAGRSFLPHPWAVGAVRPCLFIRATFQKVTFENF